MNALGVSKWYERTGIRRNPDISETDYANRSREEKYHLWFHNNVKVRLTDSDFNDAIWQKVKHHILIMK